MDLLKNLCNNSKNTFLQIFLPTCFKFIILLNNFVKMTEDIHWNAHIIVKYKVQGC